MPDNNERGDILRYINDQLLRGKTEDQIKEDLRQMGWSEQDISSPFDEMRSGRKGRAKKLMINIAATLFLVIVFIGILMLAPSSPFRYHPKNELAMTSEKVIDGEVYSVVYDNETGTIKNMPEDIARKIARTRKEREEMTKEIFINTSDGNAG